MKTTFKFWICAFGEDYSSVEFDNELDCLDAFAKELRKDNVYWGQFYDVVYWSNGEVSKEVRFAMKGSFDA